MNETLEQIQNWMTTPSILQQLTLAALVLIASFLVYVIVRRYLIGLIHRLVKQTKTTLDDKLFDNILIRRLAYLPSALVLQSSAGLFGSLKPTLEFIMMIVFIVILILVIIRLLDVINDIYETFPNSVNRPIKTYLQVLKIIFGAIGFIALISFMTDTSPWYFLSGLGAATAVLLLIFQTTILSFVASVKVTSNNMLRVGDWIEMPQYGADGDIVDISLNAVTVKNFDNTVTHIPTHKFLEETFKNWRGMIESGGRRIKRSIYIDINSIKFIDERLMTKLEKVHSLNDYLTSKVKELEAYNETRQISKDTLINGRWLTNVGTFRAYVEIYLKNRETTHPRMTCMVRQLPSGETGLPIELYLFTKEIRWVEYEKIQSDIFDHIFAVLPFFELSAFQSPTGNDFTQFGKSDKQINA